jgi:glycosyltransferase involved in cell wall biosynthesis
VRPWHTQAWAHLDLLARLAADLGPEQLHLAWPGRPPEAQGGEGRVWPGPGGGSPWGRLVFEQVGLPRVARRCGAEAVLVPYASAPLVCPAPVVAWATEPGRQRTGGLERLRASAARAGLAGAKRLLAWSDERPSAHPQRPILPVPPAVAPRFHPEPEEDDHARRRELGLEEGYVLALGAEGPDVQLVLAAWSWMAPSLGESTQLVIGPLGPGGHQSAHETTRRLGLTKSVLWVEQIPWEGLPSVLRGAAVVLFGPRLNTSQLLRWALACGLPVAGSATSSAESIVGEAGFLVAPGDSRALGAAGLSLMVDQVGITRRLREAGLDRGQGYHRAWGDGRLARAILGQS